MSLSEYNVPVEDGMVVKHGAQIRFTVTTGKRVLEDGLTDARYIGGAITRAGFTYNRLSYSGGVDWWDPETGRSIAKPKYTMRVRRQDVRTPEEIEAYNRDPEGWVET